MDAAIRDLGRSGCRGRARGTAGAPLPGCARSNGRLRRCKKGPIGPGRGDRRSGCPLNLCGRRPGSHRNPEAPRVRGNDAGRHPRVRQRARHPRSQRDSPHPRPRFCRSADLGNSRVPRSNNDPRGHPRPYGQPRRSARARGGAPRHSDSGASGGTNATSCAADRCGARRGRRDCPGGTCQRGLADRGGRRACTARRSSTESEVARAAPATAARDHSRDRAPRSRPGDCLALIEPPWPVLVGRASRRAITSSARLGRR